MCLICDKFSTYWQFYNIDSFRLKLIKERDRKFFRRRSLLTKFVGRPKSLHCDRIQAVVVMSAWHRFDGQNRIICKLEIHLPLHLRHRTPDWPYSASHSLCNSPNSLPQREYLEPRGKTVTSWLYARAIPAWD